MKHNSLSTIAILCLTLNNTSRTMDTAALAVPALTAAAGAAVAYSSLRTEQSKTFDRLFDDVSNITFACDDGSEIRTTKCTVNPAALTIYYVSAQQARRLHNSRPIDLANQTLKRAVLDTPGLLESEADYRERVSGTLMTMLRTYKTCVDRMLLEKKDPLNEITGKGATYLGQYYKGNAFGNGLAYNLIFHHASLVIK